MKTLIKLVLALALAGAALSAHAATRLKDLGDVDGVRKNQLIGYGLVVGLNGTGDGGGASFTGRSTANFLQRLGVAVNAADISVKNVAAVIVTADLASFGKAGQKADVLVSSLGDAKSLHGGTLLLTPLKATNGEIYAIAQGPVAIGGYTSSAAGSTVSKNHPTTGRIPGGAVLERDAPNPEFSAGFMDYLLRVADYTTAMRVSEAVNSRFGEGVAYAVDAGTVRIAIPPQLKDRTVEYFSTIEALSVEPDAVARVIIDEKTGTVVMGKDVRVNPVAVSHGSLTIRVTASTDVSQPSPFSEKGTTVATPVADIEAKEADAKIYLMETGESLSSLVDALNALGVSPRELVTIFQALKTAGALEAELVLM